LYYKTFISPSSFSLPFPAFPAQPAVIRKVTITESEVIEKLGTISLKNFSLRLEEKGSQVCARMLPFFYDEQELFPHFSRRIG
jgi:hypothetical protein